VLNESLPENEQRVEHRRPSVSTRPRVPTLTLAQTMAPRLRHLHLI
jgi:hypothetical protein